MMHHDSGPGKANFFYCVIGRVLSLMCVDNMGTGQTRFSPSRLPLYPFTPDFLGQGSFRLGAMLWPTGNESFEWTESRLAFDYSITIGRPSISRESTTRSAPP
jgi:hypothetical protein